MTHDITRHLNITRHLDNEAATLAFGAQMAKNLTAGLVIYLQGDLGAGKTTLVRGILRGLGYSGKVKSPTYTLVEPYIFSSYTVYHFDLYRFMDEEEWEAAGFRDYFSPHTICFIEWPSQAKNLLPAPDIEVIFNIEGDARKLQCIATSLIGKQCLAQF